MGNYDDIIYLPYPYPTNRKPISPSERAAQYSPFAALTGYDSVIGEVGRTTCPFVLLGEDEQAELERRYQILLDHLGEHPSIAITWFVPDSKKEGGSYQSCSGTVKKLNEQEQLLLLDNGTRIPLKDIVVLESSLF